VKTPEPLHIVLVLFSRETSPAVASVQLSERAGKMLEAVGARPRVDGPDLVGNPRVARAEIDVFLQDSARISHESPGFSLVRTP
jgi:hypothetical protein